MFFKFAEGMSGIVNTLERILSRGILTGLRNEPMQTSCSLSRPSARFYTWIGTISNISTD